MIKVNFLKEKWLKWKKKKINNQIKFYKKINNQTEKEKINDQISFLELLLVLI